MQPSLPQQQQQQQQQQQASARPSPPAPRAWQVQTPVSNLMLHMDKLYAAIDGPRDGSREPLRFPLLLWREDGLEVGSAARPEVGLTTRVVTEAERGASFKFAIKYDEIANAGAHK
jgi:hypothetical protein